MDCKSFDSLNVLMRCGCSANASHLRFTVVDLTSKFLAILHVLKCVTFGGVSSRIVAITLHIVIAHGACTPGLPNVSKRKFERHITGNRLLIKAFSGIIF
jgi:hypothetical protein